MDPQQAPTPQPSVQTNPTPPQAAMPGSASTEPVGENPGKTLGIVGLVLAFLMPLIGLILSIIAKNKSKKAGFSNTPAVVGIIVSIVYFVVLLPLFILVSMMATSNLQTNTGDTEAQNDINHLYAQIEVYRVDNNGAFPTTLSDLQSNSGFDSAALTEPSAEYKYVYTRLPIGCTTACTSYLLAVTLSDGSSYTKTSL